MNNGKPVIYSTRTTQTLLEYARKIVPRQLNCRERVKFFLVEKGVSGGRSEVGVRNLFRQICNGINSGLQRPTE